MDQDVDRPGEFFFDLFFNPHRNLMAAQDGEFGIHQNMNIHDQLCSQFSGPKSVPAGKTFFSGKGYLDLLNGLTVV